MGISIVYYKFFVKENKDIGLFYDIGWQIETLVEKSKTGLFIFLRVLYNIYNNINNNE